MDAKFYLLTLSFFTFIFLTFFIFSPKRIKKIWFVLWGIAPLIMLYVLSPNLRIYSFHGFMQAGVVYQLLNGNIPPFNPLLGGQIMRYPWGWHCPAALLTQALTITPFYAFALINTVSLCLVMVLVYKISQLLIEDEKANIFSAIISIFALSITDLHLVHRLRRLLHIYIPFEVRGVPLFDKFANINGVPIGLVFFLFFVYCIIKLFKNKNAGVTSIWFFIALLGCGFFYPTMLPGIVSSTVLVCLVRVVLHKNGYSPDIKKIVLLVSILLTVILCLTPYFFSITSGIRAKIQFFNLNHMGKNTIRYLVINIPILVITCINKNFLKNKVNQTAITILLSVIAANLGCYVFINLPLGVEYKYLVLSTVSLGIVGGIAFSAMNQGFKKPLVLILLLLFLIPLYRNVKWKSQFLKKVTNVSDLYHEKGRYIYAKNSEEDELYQWIRDHTDKNSIFIDSELTIPVLAQRQLFIGMDREDPLGPTPKGMKGIYGPPGYGLTIDTFLRDDFGYDPHLLDKRQAIVKSIYDVHRTLTDRELKEFFDTNKNIYVVVRTKAIEDKFKQARFDQFFRSSKGHFIVYRQGKL